MDSLLVEVPNFHLFPISDVVYSDFRSWRSRKPTPYWNGDTLGGLFWQYNQEYNKTGYIISYYPKATVPQKFSDQDQTWIEYNMNRSVPVLRDYNLMKYTKTQFVNKYGLGISLDSNQTLYIGKSYTIKIYCRNDRILHVTFYRMALNFNPEHISLNELKELFRIYDNPHAHH